MSCVRFADPALVRNFCACRCHLNRAEPRSLYIFEEPEQGAIMLRSPDLFFWPCMVEIWKTLFLSLRSVCFLQRYQTSHVEPHTSGCCEVRETIGGRGPKSYSLLVIEDLRATVRGCGHQQRAAFAADAVLWPVWNLPCSLGCWLRSWRLSWVGVCIDIPPKDGLSIRCGIRAFAV